jgi:FMN phosphatase YigB (HAD superfamily)
MKVIFDFDDTIFDTKRFKDEILFRIFERIYPHIDSVIVEKEYGDFKKLHSTFNLDTFISSVATKYKMANVNSDEIKGLIASKTKEYLIPEYKALLEKIGKENILILSQGDEVFQNFKITTSGISLLVSEIKIVEKYKEEALREFCNRFKEEKVYFFDNKSENFITEYIPKNLSQILVSEIDMVNELKGKGLENVVRVIGEVKDF